MYATESSVLTLGIPIDSNSRYAIVPVASCVSVWSILRAISEPGVISPSRRCAFIIFCAIVSPILVFLSVFHYKLFHFLGTDYRLTTLCVFLVCPSLDIDYNVVLLGKSFIALEIVRALSQYAIPARPEVLEIVTLAGRLRRVSVSKILYISSSLIRPSA